MPILGFAALVFIVAAPAQRAAAQGASPSSCRSTAPVSPTGELTPLRATGVSIGVLDSTALSSLAARTLSEALAARIPGVSVMRSSGVAGTGSRIRLRGVSGVLLAQQPLVFIDGIRVDGDFQSLGIDTGGQTPSRLDDVALDQVACVHVLRGPAAVAQYGTDAAGGVIHVATRAASPDSARISAYVDGGAASDAGDYPANFGSTTGCTRARAALSQCAAGTVRSWSPLEAVNPFHTARATQLGVRWSPWATERASAMLSADGAVTDGVFRNNDDRRYSLGGTATFAPDSTRSVRARGWAFGGSAQLPYMGDYIFSILNSALLGSSVDDPVRRGYRQFPLSALELYDVDQRRRRLGVVVDATWDAARWLTLGALAGREDSRVDDRDDSPNIRLLPNGDVGIAPRISFRTAQNRNQRSSASVSASATFGSPAFRATTLLSGHYLAETYRFEARAGIVGQENDPTSYRARWRDDQTRGLLVRQSFAWNDRRFAEAGVRRDNLDRDFARLRNPTFVFANGAWDLGGESFFPRGDIVSSLRLRAAYGQSGDSRPYDAAFELALAVPIGTPGSEARDLPVEHSNEIEGGVDLGLFDGRVTMDATYFDKRTTDALLLGLVPPSVGLPSGSLLANVGKWHTSGAEVGVRARLVDRRGLRADVAASFTALRNEVTSLGNTPPIVGTNFRITPGYPLYGAWGRPFTVTDANGDGVIVPAEVVADTGSRYLGSPVPTRELGIAPSIVVARTITIAGLIDHRGGFRASNSGGRLRCTAVCAPLYLPDASFADQARAVDLADAAAAWMEDASFVKLRELSIAWALPASWIRGLGARAASVTLAGRNLATWTSYSGLDPEVSSAGQSTIDQQDLFALPLPRTISLRLDARW